VGVCVRACMHASVRAFTVRLHNHTIMWLGH